jgi:DNA-directed RNA polymerase beta subunit
MDYADYDESEKLFPEDPWAVVNAFFSKNGLVQQQKDSYDWFMNVTLANIIAGTRTIEVRSKNQYTDENNANTKYSLKFGDW